MQIMILCSVVSFFAGVLCLLAYAAIARRLKKRKTARKGKPPPRLEFAQKMVFITSVYAMTIVVLVLGANFFLLLNDKVPMSEETITTVTVYGGITSTLVFGGYAGLTAIRNCSRNKHERKSEQPEPDEPAQTEEEETNEKPDK